jgi:glycogen debranching enzyme
MGRFWNPQTNCFFDVLDGPEGDDASVRPNQLFALAPSWQSIIDAEWTAKALAKVAKELATPLAVRTLTPLTSGYRGRYEGDQRSRDNAYHNGTAWPFLAGIRLKAEYLHDAQRGRHLARIMLADLSGQLRDGGIGSVSEVCDGDAPHDSRGCPMQAWSVGCLLDALCVALNRGGAEKESNS